MGVLDGQAISASVTNAAFLNKNQADQMTFPVSFTKTLSLSKRDESSAATINALDTSQTLINITGTVATINGAVAPATYADGATLVIANSSGSSVIINHESGSATAANRFTLPSSSPITLEPQQAAQFYYNSSSSRWKQMSGTGSGSGSAGINYITNPNAVAGTTGWATYADAAGAQPVDGTGGSPSVTWTASTTTPLRGTADFNFVKDAVNRQGQGVSYDISIDNADLAKVLTVSFDYEVLSGTYANGDLTVYLIQDPAGTPLVIQPAGYTILAGTVGTKLRQIATFQTDSAIKTYRLCFHVASPSTQDYSLAIDNVVVGPQVVQYGAPVTDWVSYTPTITSGGTTTSNAGKYHRIGDSMAVNIITIYSGAGAATALTYQLPVGFSIDTTKIPSSSADQSVVGICQWYDASAAQERTGSVVYKTATTVALIIDNNGSSVFLGSALANLDWIRLNFTVPISGWSSTVQMSNDTDTRVVAAVLEGTPTSTIATTIASSTNINFPTITNDTHSAYSSGIYTIPVSGQYIFSITVPVVGTAASPAYLDVALLVAGTAFKTDQSTAYSGTSVVHTKNCVFSGFFNAGQQISFRPQTNLTSTSWGTNGRLIVNRLSGPSAIAATETVALSYTNTAGTSLTNGATIPFATKTFDTHGAWNGTTFTAPVSGTYQFSLQVYYASASFTATPKSMLLYVGVTGTRYVGIINPSAAYTGVLGQNGMATIQLLAGQQVAFTAVHNESTARLLDTTSGANHISIVRVGN